MGPGYLSAISCQGHLRVTDACTSCCLQLIQNNVCLHGAVQVWLSICGKILNVGIFSAAFQLKSFILLHDNLFRVFDFVPVWVI